MAKNMGTHVKKGKKKRAASAPKVAGTKASYFETGLVVLNFSCIGRTLGGPQLHRRPTL